MRSGGARGALGFRDFRLLWLAQGVSEAGDSLTWMALILAINRLTGSASMIGSLSVVLTLPQLGLGLFAGVMADRWDRRVTMIVSDLVRGALVLGFLLVREPRDLWMLYVIGLAEVSVGVFFSPARSALTPSTVDPDSLLAANSLLQTTQLITGLAGTALAGVLFSLTKTGWPAFVLDAASFFFSAACVAGIRAPARPERSTDAAAPGVLRELRQGLALIARTRALLAILMAFGLASLGTGAVSVLFVPFLVNTLRLPPATLGLAKAAQMGGLLLGGAWAARRAVARSSTRLIGGGLAGVGVAMVLLGTAPNLAFVMLWLILLGLCATPMQSATNALLLQRTPDALRGRVESAVDTLLTVVMMGSMAWAGILADRVGTRMVLSGSGLLCVAGGLVGWAMLTRGEAAGDVTISGA